MLACILIPTSGLNSDDRVVSPYFDTEQEAQEWCGDKITELDDPKRLEFERESKLRVG
jgi:hypothetical protein